MDLLPPVNHVFIDFENVHEFDLEVIGARSVSLTLLAGANHTKLDAALVERLLQHASSVQLVRLTSCGRNALDFALVYYLGRAVVADPGGCFHIVSKDKGYAPLVEHLKSRNIRVERHEDMSTLFLPGMPPGKPVVAAKLAAIAKPKAVLNPRVPAMPKAAPKATLRVSGKELRLATVLDFLHKAPANRPKKDSKLLSHLVAHFGKAGSEAKARAVIDELRRGGHIAISETGAITYGAALE